MSRWDNTQARGEGWDIFDLKIGRVTSAMVFGSDAAAADVVASKALAGSTYHQQAMAIVTTRNWDFGRQWVEVFGNYGRFKADLDTGEVFDNEAEEYRDIARVDVDELKTCFGAKHGETWDVVLVGCWNKDGVYDDPTDARLMILDPTPEMQEAVRPKEFEIMVSAMVPVFMHQTVEAANISAAEAKVDLDDRTWTISGEYGEVQIRNRGLLDAIELETTEVTRVTPTPSAPDLERELVTEIFDGPIGAKLAQAEVQILVRTVLERVAG